MENELDFKIFFPNEFIVKKVDSDSNTLQFTLESSSKKAVCPICKKISSTYHGKRSRKNITDLPVLDQNVLLNITLREYICSSDGIFAENPDDFLISRKSITTRCQNYLSSVKHILNGKISSTCAVADSAHISVGRGVIRYIPVDIDIYESDKLWIYDIIKETKIHPEKWSKEELLHYIHEHCEENLHPNLIDLSLYDLTSIVASNENLKGRLI